MNFSYLTVSQEVPGEQKRASGMYQKKKVNAKSIMGMMTLGLDSGENVTISVNGVDETEAMKEIEGYLTSK